ncbi:MAG: hypothetical protein IJC87_00795 [Clostridia bacterium]|nr:hypothetical protein [Clostridia bacterium]
MVRISDIEIKSFFKRASEAKNSGESLSKVFDEFAKKTGRAKGSVRNFYYSSLKKAETDLVFKEKFLDGNQLSRNKIIVFDEAESKMLLEKILIGQTFGKSVRRVISEMTQNPQIALRYQNKYRNLLKYDKKTVEKICRQIEREYGKCFNPYQIKKEDGKQISVLKREINLLCERIALSLKEENFALKKKLEQSERENKTLKSLLEKSLEKSQLQAELKNLGAG